MVRFGRYALDEARRQLVRDHTPVHLTPKAFDLLKLLAAEAPRVVAKAELHARLWPGTYVSDATLTGLIKELRRALEDRDADSPVIRTAHRIGYGLCLEVRQETAAPERAAHGWLVLRGRRAALCEGENLIGRDPASHVWLDAPGVSRRHARVVIDGDGARVEDLGSKNGTLVGEVPATTPVALQDGDRIAFGPIAGIYRTASDGMATESVGRSEPARPPARR
jgi:DNA-binding winged helix-turn-helix (wHTH) protein